ncbi:hypothetical protein BRARA_F01990 [Brassica rapa]|uniref:CCHC-type domain-containing protein n=1 Tax=Brassica campestris TaxID=3711 RepID=A0A397Z938_BRACM|nr:hypothetical protein BRARA_F01990 [Brassica rapa]
MNFLRTNFSIKTEERDIQLTKPFETIHLFSESALQRHREKNFKYIHIGLVQVGIKPLSKEGLNTSILAILRDTRFKVFEDSLLSSVESSLCTGPISFDCYPNFTVFLNDKNILKSLVLQVKTYNYEMIEGSIPIALIFRVHYKAMTSAFSSKVKLSSKKGETMLLQTDLSRSNSIIPRSIQWKDINLPDEWVLEGAVQPKLPAPQESIEPNTRLKHIEQFRDGKVKLSFIRNNQDRIDEYLCGSSSNMCESSSNPETIDLGRVSQLGHDFPREEKSMKFRPRSSTSDIPNSVLRNVNFHKSPMFKPFQISNSSVKTYQDTNLEFIRALRSQLSKAEIGDSSMPHIFDIPDTPTSKIQINTLANDSDISECSDQNSVPKINRLDWQNHQDRQLISAPDLGQIQPIEQSRFNSSSVYDWNIDGISEYNILTELLIAGFSGQLKGWWDNYLTNQQRTEILDSIKTDEDNVPILDNLGNPQQDAVATLVIAITLHFIGDPSVLRDKNVELLSNLKCKKLSNFQWYKNTFLLESYSLVSIVQQEGLRICQDLKLQKQLKWELKRTKVELGSFCKQFESKSCVGDCNKNYYSKNTPRKHSRNYKSFRSRENSWKKPQKKFPSKETPAKKPFYKDLTCFKCNKKGHTAKFCRFNRKIQELNLGEEISNKIANLLLNDSSSSYDSDSSVASEKALQVDELNSSSSSSESNEKNIYVLTKDQELQLEILNSISDPSLKQKFLEKIISSLNE